MKEKLKIYAIHSFDEDSREHEMFKKDYYKHVDLRNEPNNEFINEASIVTWLRDNWKDNDADFLGVCHYRRTLKIDENNLDWKKIYVHTEDLKMPIETNYILFHSKQFYDMFKHTFQTKFSKKWRLACENWDKYFKSEGMPFYGRNLFVMSDIFFDDWLSFMWDCIDVALSAKQAMSNDEIWTNVYDKRTAGAMLERMTSYFIWL